MYNQNTKNRYGVQTGDLFIAKIDNEIVCLQVIEIYDGLNVCVTFHKLVNADISHIFGLYWHFPFGRYLA